jgi:hypothetical protein
MFSFAAYATEESERFATTTRHLYSDAVRCMLSSGRETNVDILDEVERHWYPCLQQEAVELRCGAGIAIGGDHDATKDFGVLGACFRPPRWV